MKKTLLSFLLFVIFQLNAFAQSGYTFNQSTATYTDLPAPTLITNNVIWDDTSVTVPLGFNFTLGGITYTDVEITSNGVLLLNQGTTFAAIVGYDADLESLGTASSTSPIGYQVTGNAGSRIFKVQWKNAGFYDGTPADFVNLQTWLYEGSNKVETRIGTSNISNALQIFGTAGGPANGLATNIDFVSETITGIFLQGAPGTATAIGLTNSASYPFLSGPPVNTTMYIYTPMLIGLPETINQAKLSVYPNPVSEVLQIEGLHALKGNITVKIYDALGKVVLTQVTASSASIPVNVNQLNKGIYFVEITSGKERAGKQIIKL